MKDRYNREINYLRISVTDRCNLRCMYCMPEGGISCVPMEEVLTFEEIVRICKQAAGLGISRLKITGGEPLVRKGVENLVKMLKEIDGIEQVTMTTNGTLLDGYIDKLIGSGLDGINISIDSLDEDGYRQITRNGNLDDALRGLRLAIDSGINVKVNSVLFPENDFKKIINIAKENEVDVRFIETMPIGMGDRYAGIYKEDILKFFEEQGTILNVDGSNRGNGPAVYFKPEGYKGNIGIIAPIHGKFCDSCNRIRLSATGMIKPCLCYSEVFDVKKCVREGSDEDIYNALRSAILAKPEGHRFSEKGYVTETKCMSEIGG